MSMEQFKALGISDRMLEALAAKGFDTPSDIQSATVPLLLAGECDVIGQARTGTGKTAAFGIPIIETLERGSGRTGALILSPTRELSLQTAGELTSMLGGKKLRIAAFYGGEPIQFQLEKLKGGIDIAVGTPGRVLDLMRRGALTLDKVDFAVLDEADEMLDMGFIDDIKTILGETAPGKRMLMFSATMPDPILEIAAQFMRPGYQVVRTVVPETDETRLTEQIAYKVRRVDKLDALTRLIDLDDNMYAMVFCRTKGDVDELSSALRARGIDANALHGDIAQSQRIKIINGFKERHFKLLIATDVAARGIDVNDLSHVINYSIPQNSEIYIHRIGRTGRAGHTGIAVTFVTPGEIRTFERIRHELNVEIPLRPLPSTADVIEARKQRFLREIEAVIAAKQHCDCLNFAEELVASREHPAELVAAMLKLRFGDQLTVQEKTEPRKHRAGDSSPEDVKLVIRFGRRDGADIGTLTRLIFEETGIRSSQLGKIEMRAAATYVFADAADARRIVDAFRHLDEPTFHFADAAGAADATGSERPLRRGGYERGGYKRGERGGYERPARRGDEKSFSAKKFRRSSRPGKPTGKQE